MICIYMLYQIETFNKTEQHKQIQFSHYIDVILDFIHIIKYNMISCQNTLLNSLNLNQLLMTDNLKQIKFCNKNIPKLNKTSHQTFYQQCKDVISGLLQQNHKLYLEIARKDQIVQQLLLEKEKFNNHNQFNSLIHKQNNQKLNQSNIQKIEKLQTRIKDYQQILQQKDNQITNLEEQLQQMHSQLSKTELMAQTYQNNMQQMRQDMQVYQQKLLSVEQQNNILAATLHENQIQSSYQIEQLRKYNQKLKKRIQLLSQTKQQSYLQTLKFTEFSQSKRPSNLIMTTNKRDKQTEKYQQNHQLKPLNYAYIQGLKNQIESTPTHQQNPQLNYYLDHTKQRSSYQDRKKYKISEDSYNKQKNKKALQKLQNKIAKMISNIELSDTESCKN